MGANLVFLPKLYACGTNLVSLAETRTVRIYFK